MKMQIELTDETVIKLKALKQNAILVMESDCPIVEQTDAGLAAWLLTHYIDVAHDHYLEEHKKKLRLV